MKYAWVFLSPNDGTNIVIDVTGLRNDWVDNLVSKEYKGNSAEISGKLYIYIYIKNCSYEYISYILSL